jgi:hypothetical protein
VKRALLLLVSAIVVSTASAASTCSWHKVATASDDSDYYAAAHLDKTARSYGSKVRVRATSTAKVTGSVLCTKGFKLETATFSFRRRRGSKRIPTPILGGKCDYSVLRESGNTIRAIGGSSAFARDEVGRVMENF